jgi:hypothetical protein
LAKKIGEILVERGLLQPQHVSEGLASQKFYGGRVGSLWVEMGILEEKDLLEALCSQQKAKPVKASQLKAVTKATLDLIPVKVAVRYKCIPLVKEGRRLTVAMASPNDLLTLDELAFITGCVIEPLLATERTILNALEAFYGVEKKKRDVVNVAGLRKASLVSAEAAPPSDAPAQLATSRAPGSDTQELLLDDATAEEKEQARKFWADAGKAPPAAPAKLPSGAPPPAPPPAAAALAALSAAPTPSGGVTAPLPPPASASLAAEPVAPAATAVAEDVADGNALLLEEGDSTVMLQPGPTIEEASRRLARADVRDDIADVILWCTEALFERSALFIFQKSQTIGWTGQGAGLRPEDVRRVVMPVEEVSLFTLVRDNPHHYMGIMPDNPPNHRLIETMGGAWPPGVLVIPFGIKGRALGCLYAEDSPDELAKVDLNLLFRLLQKAGLALEVLLLRSKLIQL